MGEQHEESPYQKSVRTGSPLHQQKARRWPNRSSSLASVHLDAIYRFLFFVALVGAWFLIGAHRSSKASLRAKYQPTKFGASEKSVLEAGGFHWEGNLDDDVVFGKLGSSDVWQHREDWTPLGSGFEGDTFLYKNYVIKTFKTIQSPPRNCLPSDISPALAPTQRRWPSEIPASLLLGGLAAGEPQEGQAVPDQVDFVPVQGVFLAPAPAPAAGPATWHLVSPFLRSGHLYKLAKRLSSLTAPSSARALDARFRPSLNKLLSALDTMHNEHKLCHDDIKPDNIFVASYSASHINESEAAVDTHWLLADLGNVRQIDHAYHASQLWWSRNGQLVDCRANDVVRLVKSYVRFLQLASAAAVPTDADDAGTPAPNFTQAFLQGAEPWSRLYWEVLADHDQPEADDKAAGRGASTAAAAALLTSLEHVPLSAARGDGGYSGSPSVPARIAPSRGRHSWRLDAMVNQELRKGMTTSDTLTRWLGMNGVSQTLC
jgi:hypothetical protein